MIPLDTIIQGDCLEVMKEIPDKSVDLVLTDPPYNAGLIYANYNDSMPEDDYFSWLAVVWKDIRRVSKGVIITPGSKNFLNFIDRIERPKWVASWTKTNQCSPSPLGGFNGWEPVLIYGNVKLGIDAWNISITNCQKSIGAHPCPKSLDVWLELIKGCPEGGLVLDPFLSSGTTAVAAKRAGRHFIGIELSEEYCEIARKRVASVPARLDRWGDMA